MRASFLRWFLLNEGDASGGFGSVQFPLKRDISPHGRVTALSMIKDEGY